MPNSTNLLFASLGIALSASCTGANTMGRPADGCMVVSTPLAESSWEGSEVGDLLVALTAEAPSSVVWDDSALGMTESVLEAGWTLSDGAATVEERSGFSGIGWADCRPGPELVVPIDIELDVDNGCISGSLQGQVAADLDGKLYVHATGAASLCESLEEVAQDAAAQDCYDTGCEETFTYSITIVGPEWTGAQVALGARSEHRALVLVRGQWQ